MPRYILLDNQVNLKVRLIYLNNPQCPINTIRKIEGSSVVCVSQNQSQSQSQTQDNNQSVNVSNTNNNSISNSGSALAAATSAPTSTPTSTPTSQPQATQKGSTPQVIAQTPTQTKELPKTGLPLAGWALASLLPVGFKLKNLGHSKDIESANTLWEEKQFRK